MSRGLLTSSRLRDARACQRLHHYRYQLGYRPAQDAASLRFGSLVHKGLEAWWRAPTNRLDAALVALAAESSDPFDLARARALLVGYDARWSDEPFEVLGVEVEFSTRLENPATGKVSQTWDLAGKLDVLVKHLPTDRVLIMEHKTSSEDVAAGSDYWKKLRLDGQVSLYYVGGRSLGFDIGGCLYDVLGKPKLRPYQPSQKRSEPETPAEYERRCMEAIAAAPHEFFVRGEVPRLEQDVEDALHDVWQLGRQIRESELAGRHPRNPEACVRFGRTCAFFDVCTGTAALDDQTKFVRLETVHPELGTVGATAE